MSDKVLRPFTFLNQIRREAFKKDINAGNARRVLAETFVGPSRPEDRFQMLGQLAFGDNFRGREFYNHLNKHFDIDRYPGAVKLYNDALFNQKVSENQAEKFGIEPTQSHHMIASNYDKQDWEKSILENPAKKDMYTAIAMDTYPGLSPDEALKEYLKRDPYRGSKNIPSKPSTWDENLINLTPDMHSNFHSLYPSITRYNYVAPTYGARINKVYNVESPDAVLPDEMSWEELMNYINNRGWAKQVDDMRKYIDSGKPWKRHIINSRNPFLEEMPQDDGLHWEEMINGED